MYNYQEKREGKGGKKKKKLTPPRTPRHQRHRNPHQIRIPIQTSTLQQIRTLTPIPLQHAPKPHGHKRSIPIHQPRSSTQQLEIIRKVSLTLLRKVLINRPRQKQDNNNRRSNPHGAVKIRVSLENVEEIGARVDCRTAAFEDFGCVDVKGLGVEV
jgi:hypothetical protein